MSGGGEGGGAGTEAIAASSMKHRMTSVNSEPRQVVAALQRLADAAVTQGARISANFRKRVAPPRKRIALRATGDEEVVRLSGRRFNLAFITTVLFIGSMVGRPLLEW